MTTKHLPFSLNCFALCATAATASLLAPPPVNAFVVTVNNEQWDVTTVQGKFRDPGSGLSALGVTLTNTANAPWWGSQSLANSFASAVAGNLGYPNPCPIGPGSCDGPYFAYALNVDPNYINAAYVNQGTGGNQVFDSIQNSGYSPPGGFLTYATATRVNAQVPAPLPIFGAAAAFGYSRKLRKRLLNSKRPACSARGR